MFTKVIWLLFVVSTAQAQQTESYKNLIEKARNLTLQRDRLQASQVLQRALQKEPKNSPAFKEMSRALEDLMVLFYTEKGQSMFAQGDAAVDANPKAAIESYQAALRAEDGNVTVLKALSRTHLRASECDKADGYIKQAESMNPYSAEIRLLRMQHSDCAGLNDLLNQQLIAAETDLAPVEKFVKGLQIKDAFRRKDAKKAKAFLAAWEQTSVDYPEVFYWKYKLSTEGEPVDRLSANKYLQLCQNLSLRKKKDYYLDVDLCKEKAKVEEELKSLSAKETTASGGTTNE